MKDVKVYSAAILGFGAPGINWFLQNAEPILKDLVLLGQFGVAAVTILYVLRKWKQLKDDKKKDDNDDAV